MKVTTIVIGGPAAGKVLAVDAGATRIRLSAPVRLKPLTAATQTTPDVVTREGDYDFHLIEMQNNGDKRRFVYGIAVCIDGDLKQCSECKGSGEAGTYYPDGSPQPCSECDGEGAIKQTLSLTDGFNKLIEGYCFMQIAEEESKTPLIEKN